MGSSQFLDVVVLFKGSKGPSLKISGMCFKSKLPNPKAQPPPAGRGAVTKLTTVASTACSNPRHNGSPLATTSTHRTTIAAYFAGSAAGTGLEHAVASDFAQLEPTHLSLPGGILPAKLVRDMSSPVLELRFMRRNFAIQNLSRACYGMIPSRQLHGQTMRYLAHTS